MGRAGLCGYSPRSAAASGVAARGWQWRAGGSGARVAVARGWQHVGEGARRSGAGAPSSTPARLRRGREAPHGPRAMDDTGGIDVDAIARKAVNGLNKAWGWLSGEDQAKAAPARTAAPGRAHTSPASDQQVHGSYPTQQQWGQHHQQQQEQQPPQPATYAAPTYSPPSLSPQASVNASWSAAPPLSGGSTVEWPAAKAGVRGQLAAAHPFIPRQAERLHRSRGAIQENPLRRHDRRAGGLWDSVPGWIEHLRRQGVDFAASHGRKEY